MSSPHLRQGRHEHRRTSTLPAQQQRRREAHRGLAPPRALHDERASPVVHERADRLKLPLVNARVVAPHEGAQNLGGGCAGVGACHALSLSGAVDRGVWVPADGRLSGTRLVREFVSQGMAQSARNTSAVPIECDVQIIPIRGATCVHANDTVWTTLSRSISYASSVFMVRPPIGTRQYAS